MDTYGRGGNNRDRGLASVSAHFLFTPKTNELMFKGSAAAATCFAAALKDSGPASGKHPEKNRMPTRTEMCINLIFHVININLLKLTQERSSSRSTEESLLQLASKQ